MDGLATVLCSGLLSLVVSVVVAALNSLKESRAEKRQQGRERKAKLEAIYVDQIAIFEKYLRAVEGMGSYAETHEETARPNARLRLLSTRDVITEAEKASELMFKWSGEYRAGMPKSVPGSDLVRISSGDSEHLKKAQELYPELIDQINKMISAMTGHLASIQV